jgi:hypothetical protein
MASIWQFVDSIGAAPTVRLDLNAFAAGGIYLAETPTISPPELRRVEIASMLADGEQIPASAFDNRVITMQLNVAGASADAVATMLQTLARELARLPGNILRVMVGTTPMFFQTFPAPDAAFALRLADLRRTVVTVQIPCKPFGLGLKETLSQVTVTNNPAAGTNGQFFDIASPKGDVETPLTMTIGTTLGVTGRLRSAFAVRRRGTVASAPLVLQAEAMSQGTDTSIQANNASFSGAGSNYSRCTFATNTSGQQRIFTATTWPTAGVDIRGTYRVFVRGRKNTGADVIDVALQWGDTNAVTVGPLVRWPTTNTSLQYVELGRIQIPNGYDPIYDGETGVEITPMGSYISLYVRRPSGSGSFDMDLLLFLPADDAMEFVKWPAVQASGTDVFVTTGGRRPAAYCLSSGGQLRSTEPIEIAGQGMMITPGITNRIYFVRDVGSGVAAAGTSDSLTATHTVIPSYHPRYLFPFKPVGT